MTRTTVPARPRARPDHRRVRAGPAPDGVRPAAAHRRRPRPRRADRVSARAEPVGRRGGGRRLAAGAVRPARGRLARAGPARPAGPRAARAQRQGARGAHRGGAGPARARGDRRRRRPVRPAGAARRARAARPGGSGPAAEPLRPAALARLVGHRPDAARPGVRRGLAGHPGGAPEHVPDHGRLRPGRALREPGAAPDRPRVRRLHGDPGLAVRAAAPARRRALPRAAGPPGVRRDGPAGVAAGRAGGAAGHGGRARRPPTRDWCCGPGWSRSRWRSWAGGGPAGRECSRRTPRSPRRCGCWNAGCAPGSRWAGGCAAGCPTRAAGCGWRRTPPARLRKQLARRRPDETAGWVQTCEGGAPS